MWSGAEHLFQDQDRVHVVKQIKNWLQVNMPVSTYGNMCFRFSQRVRELYPNKATVVTLFSSFMKIIKQHKTREYVSTAYAYFCDPEFKHARRRAYMERLREKNMSPHTMPLDTLRTFALSVREAQRWEYIMAPLLLCIGARATELLFHNEYQIESNWIRVNHLSKKRNETGTCLRPCLFLDAEEFLFHLQRGRELLRVERGEQPVPAAYQRLLHVVKEFFSHGKCHHLRKYYAVLSHRWFGGNSNLNTWINQVLGHSPHDMHASFAYSTHLVNVASESALAAQAQAPQAEAQPIVAEDDRDEIIEISELSWLESEDEDTLADSNTVGDADAEVEVKVEVEPCSHLGKRKQPAPEDMQPCAAIPALYRGMTPEQQQQTIQRALEAMEQNHIRISMRTLREHVKVGAERAKTIYTEYVESKKKDLGTSVKVVMLTNTSEPTPRTADSKEKQTQFSVPLSASPSAAYDDKCHKRKTEASEAELERLLPSIRRVYRGMKPADREAVVVDGITTLRLHGIPITSTVLKKALGLGSDAACLYAAPFA